MTTPDLKKIDIDRVRADTAACARLTHLNNAGASLAPDIVTDAMVDYIRLEADIGGYAAAAREGEKLDRVYAAGAELLGCEPSEIAFASGASEAWWRAFSAVHLTKGDTILAGRSEFVSSGIALIQARQRGVNVVIIDNDEHGQLDVARLAERLDDSVKLVCLTHVPMTSGLVNPVAEVGELVKAAGAYFLLDACQSVGQLPVSVDAVQCDFLSVTGRKWLRGPRGTALLYVRQSIFDALEPPVFIDGTAAAWTSATSYHLEESARRFEFGEFSYAAKVGLGVALGYATAVGLAPIQARVQRLAARLRSELHKLANVFVYDQGIDKCGIVTFTVEGRTPDEIVASMRKLSINLAAPPARASWLDIGAKGIPSIVRASVHYYNTDAEIDRLVAALSTAS